MFNIFPGAGDYRKGMLARFAGKDDNLPDWLNESRKSSGNGSTPPDRGTPGTPPARGTPGTPPARGTPGSSPSRGGRSQLPDFDDDTEIRSWLAEKKPVANKPANVSSSAEEVAETIPDWLKAKKPTTLPGPKTGASADAVPGWLEGFAPPAGQGIPPPPPPSASAGIEQKPRVSRPQGTGELPEWMSHTEQSAGGTPELAVSGADVTPMDASTYALSAIQHAISGQQDRCVTEFEQALKLNPKLDFGPLPGFQRMPSLGFAALATAYISLGGKKPARALLNYALARFPDDEDLELLRTMVGN